MYIHCYIYIIYTNSIIYFYFLGFNGSKLINIFKIYFFAYLIFNSVNAMSDNISRPSDDLK